MEVGGGVAVEARPKLIHAGHLIILPEKSMNFRGEVHCVRNCPYL